MPVFTQELLQDHLTVLDPSEFIKNNQTIPVYVDRSDDVAWMLACSLILFTMQTGIALMESGMCSLKNEVHLLMKNLAACCFGGLTYWAIGWSMSMGQGAFSTPFNGWGDWFYEPDWLDGKAAERALTFFYQESLNALSTSIVSGAVAERVNFRSFMLFSVLNTIVFSVPACWMWSPQGFLKQLGAIDNAGCGVVHLVGGFSSLVATLYLGPRTGLRFNNETVVMGNPTFCCAGLFITWWGYLAMNSASTLGVEGTRWLQSAKATVLTMLSSFGGGSTALVLCYVFYGHTIPVGRMVNPTMGSLVAYTGITFLCTSTESIVIGAVAGFLVFLSMGVLDKYDHIDDPCCTFIVHGVCGVWGMLAVGIFTQEDTISKGFTFSRYSGVLYGGGYLILVQALACLVFAVWAVVSTYLILRFIDYWVPLRGDIVSELLGGDLMEHNILHLGIGIEETLDTLKHFHQELEKPVKEDNHWKYMKKAWKISGLDVLMGTSQVNPEDWMGRREITEDDIDRLKIVLGVQNLTKEDLNEFRGRLANLQPRKVEGFGFGNKVQEYAVYKDD